jgi:RHS repeat-associated protein
MRTSDLTTRPAVAEQAAKGDSLRRDGDGGNTLYHHRDLIDSSMLLTDSGGTGLQPVVSYTAFGEPIISGAVGGEFASGQPRYGYAGGFGYESGHYQDPPEGSNLPGFSDLLALYGPNTALAPITLQHVGWRWYQPGIGRFVQRDPIGTRGGGNTYVYVANCPVSLADPLGLDPGLAICEYCGRSGGHAPGCPLYCKPDRNPKPRPNLRPVRLAWTTASLLWKLGRELAGAGTLFGRAGAVWYCVQIRGDDYRWWEDPDNPNSYKPDVKFGPDGEIIW